MKNTEIKTINLVIKNYNRRTEARINLPIVLHVRRPQNSLEYWREVQTVNVSSSGLCINSDVMVEVGDQLEICAFEKQFNATAEVKYVHQRWDGKWSIGMKFLKKEGRWIVT